MATVQPRSSIFRNCRWSRSGLATTNNKPGNAPESEQTQINLEYYLDIRLGYNATRHKSPRFFKQQPVQLRKCTLLFLFRLCAIQPPGILMKLKCIVIKQLTYGLKSTLASCRKRGSCGNYAILPIFTERNYHVRSNRVWTEWTLFFRSGLYSVVTAAANKTSFEVFTCISSMFRSRKVVKIALVLQFIIPLLEHPAHLIYLCFVLQTSLVEKRRPTNPPPSEKIRALSMKTTMSKFVTLTYSLIWCTTFETPVYKSTPRRSCTERFTFTQIRKGQRFVGFVWSPDLRGLNEFHN